MRVWNHQYRRSSGLDIALSKKEDTLVETQDPFGRNQLGNEH